MALSMLFALVVGDSWDSPPPERYSADKSLMLSVSRDKNRKIRLALKRTSPGGWTTLWKIDSPQEREPHVVHFAPDKSVVLQDQWGEIGYGRVLVFISPAGKVLKTYELDDFLPEDEPKNLTISSRWWLMHGRSGIRKDGRQYAFVTRAKTYRCFDLSSGTQVAMNWALKADIRNEFVLAARSELQSKDPRTRSLACSVLMTTEDRASIPALRKLLDDPWVTRYYQHGHPDFADGSYQSYGVQLSAAYALTRLDPNSLLPVVEARLKTANPYMASHWIQTIGVNKTPEIKAFLKRLLSGSNRRIARMAKSALGRES